jgi:hypothetical protein
VPTVSKSFKRDGKISLEHNKWNAGMIVVGGV